MDCSISLHVLLLHTCPVPAGQTFCWLDSYPRGAGSVPTNLKCDDGWHGEMGMCYKNCANDRRSLPGSPGACWVKPENFDFWNINSYSAVINLPKFPQGYNCDGGRTKDAGLCYENCRDGYLGVGPVCWYQAPPGWVGCGMGAAASSQACAQVISSQVLKMRVSGAQKFVHN